MKKWGLAAAGVGMVCLTLGGVTVAASRFTSPNYTIDTSVIGSSTSGGQSSTNYQLVSTSGQSIIGNGASGSYKMGQGYSAPSGSSMQVVVQPNGLSGYWPLDDVVASGTAHDTSQHSNDGSYSANSVITPGKVSTAWGGADDSQTITIPHSASHPTSDKMTISVWVNPYSAANRGIITKWMYNISGTNQGQYALQMETNRALRMFVTNGIGDDGERYATTEGGLLTIGAWNHVMVVYDGTQSAAQRLKFFVNGVQVSSTVNGTIPSTLYASSDPITIGAFPGLIRPWSGSIDEVKIFSRALNPVEVKAEYDATNAGVPAGLTFGTVTPGASKTASFDSIVQTDASNYTLAISQDANLTSGGNTIPAVSGTFGSPTNWSEGSTKGLGFTLFNTNATAIPGSWNSGNAYAALPSTPTSFYARTGATGSSKDYVNMRLRLDVPPSQPTGDYTNVMTVTGTMLP